MTGWMNGANVAFAVWPLGAVPAGWLGVVMILATVLSIVSDLAVSGLVVTVNVPSRCTFNTSGYYTIIPQSPLTANIIPANAGALFKLINQAQLNSVTNGGLGGIYGKVNGDPSFRADYRDVVGQWNCNDTMEDRSYPYGTDPTSIETDLQSQGLLFNESSYSCWQNYPDYSIGRIVLLTASQPDWPTAPWDFRASIDITLDSEIGQSFKTYLCHMDGPSIQWVINQTQAQSTLTSWCGEFMGDLFTADVSELSLAPNPAAVLESILNSIVMTSGAAWNLMATPIPDDTQGCLAPQAQVSWPIILLFALVAILTFAMALYWAVLSILLHEALRSQPAGRIKVIDNYVPNGLLNWMVQAVRQSGVAGEVKPKDLKDWFFGYDLDGQRIKLRKS